MRQYIKPALPLILALLLLLCVLWQAAEIASITRRARDLAAEIEALRREQIALRLEMEDKPAGESEVVFVPGAL